MTCLANNDRILYQYKNTTKFLDLYNGLVSVIEMAAACDLYGVYDLANAEGVWLDNIASVFNESRYYSGIQDAFTLDVTPFDDIFVWDGVPSSASDVQLRNQLYARIIKDESAFTLNDILKILILTINPVDVIITEGDKHLDIDIWFTDAASLALFNELSSVDPKWFGVPAGVSIIVNRHL